ncbi:MAG: queuosine salvage family protein [Candidatus Melainabacteria bacterium]|nr:queuosine salvage family protein [Candidatus Melainabacteria bacterium]
MNDQNSRITLSIDKKAQPILHSAAYVAARAKFVSINLAALKKLATDLRHNLGTDNGTESGASHWLESAPALVKNYFKSLSLENRLLFLKVFHTIGFCYWAEHGSKPWTIEGPAEVLSERKYNGAMALLVSMATNADFLNLEYLASLNLEQFKTLLAGQGSNIDSLALLTERHEFIVALAQNLSGENYLQVLLPQLATASARELALKFANELPGYLDIAQYNGKEILFLKRAQLLVSDLNHTLVSSATTAIYKIEELTAFADYKLPQLLRHYQVLIYEAALAQRIDEQIELAPGSAEEVEIRATTIVAVELIRQELEKLGLACSAAAIDNQLWQLSQRLDKSKVKPYHRCRTIFY